MHKLMKALQTFDILSSSAEKDLFYHCQSFPAHREGFPDPLPVEKLMTRECPCSTKTGELLGNPPPPPLRFPSTQSSQCQQATERDLLKINSLAVFFLLNHLYWGDMPWGPAIKSSIDRCTLKRFDARVVSRKTTMPWLTSP